MKKVFSSADEVCHVFAKQSQYEGQAGNVYFYDKELFSYGSHYVIARFISQDNVLLSTNTYSSSTSRHLRLAARALNHKNIIPVYQVNKSISELFTHYTYQINNNLKKAVKAIKNRDSYLSYALHNYNEIENYLSYVSPQEYKKELKALKKLVTFPDLSGIKKAIQAEKEEEKQKKKYREKELSEKIELWKNNKSDYHLYYTDTVYLRVKNDFVETSYGARVSLASARILYALINAKRDINGHKIDGFTVISYLDGILKIGCHKIPQIEIDRISPLLK
jgi:RecG-like helicase